MENRMQMISEQLMSETCQKQMYGVLDFPAKTYLSPGKDSDSLESVQVCFSQLQDLLKTLKKKINPQCYLLRTLKTYLVLIEDLTLPNFSLSWMKSATMLNGKFSIQKTSEFHKAEKECTLFDFLEEEAEEKYNLSEDQVAKIIYH